MNIVTRKEKTTSVVDFKKKNCTCCHFCDKAMCLHLIRVAIIFQSLTIFVTTLDKYIAVCLSGTNFKANSRLINSKFLLTKCPVTPT